MMSVFPFSLNVVSDELRNHAMDEPGEPRDCRGSSLTSGHDHTSARRESICTCTCTCTLRLICAWHGGASCVVPPSLRLRTDTGRRLSFRSQSSLDRLEAGAAWQRDARCRSQWRTGGPRGIDAIKSVTGRRSPSLPRHWLHSVGKLQFERPAEGASTAGRDSTSRAMGERWEKRR